jgi:hypothetical protein
LQLAPMFANAQTLISSINRLTSSNDVNNVESTPDPGLLRQG